MLINSQFDVDTHNRDAKPHHSARSAILKPMKSHQFTYEGTR